MKPDKIIGAPDAPYLLRWHIIPRNRFFNIYLHHILRSDDDRALHDHPWWNVSIILSGGYWEIVPKGHYRGTPFFHALNHKWRRPFVPILRRAKAAHRLELFMGEPCWSLFITGPVIREWGFWCPKGWRHWKDFVNPLNVGEIDPGCE